MDLLTAGQCPLHWNRPPGHRTGTVPLAPPGLPLSMTLAKTRVFSAAAARYSSLKMEERAGRAGIEQQAAIGLYLLVEFSEAIENVTS